MAHGLLYNSTLGSRVMKKKKKKCVCGGLRDQGGDEFPMDHGLHQQG